MWKSHLLVAVRVLLRNKLTSAINVVGLSAALAVCVLALLFVRHEMSYDGWHERGDRIHLVYVEEPGSGIMPRATMLPAPVEDAIRNDYAGIARTARIQLGFPETVQGVEAGDEWVAAVDPDFLRMLTFPLDEGDAATALDDPASVVLAAPTARRLFGDADPVGQRITLGFSRYDDSVQPPRRTSVEAQRVVTGVLAPIPETSSLRFGMLLPHAVGHEMQFNTLPGLFVELSAGTDATRIEAELAGLSKGGDDTRQLHLRPVEDLHFGPSIAGPGAFGTGSAAHCYILSGVAALILLIAGINFVNLALGRSLTRTMEVGVRKAVGAGRGQLVRLFLVEAGLVTALAVAGGLALAEALLPSFNAVVGQHLELGLLSAEVLAGALLLTVAVAILAGLYPALAISRWQPVGALQGKVQLGGRNRGGQALIVVQFALSTFLTVVALAMAQQVDFMVTKDLGFDGDRVVLVGLDGGVDELALQRLSEEIANHPSQVLSVAGAAPAPGGGEAGATAMEVGGEPVPVMPFYVSPGFVGTIGMRLSVGRDFDPQRFGTDRTGAVLLNETAARLLEGDPVGQTVRIGRGEQATPMTVIGVVEDFHWDSLRRRIGPALLQLQGSAEFQAGEAVRYWHVLARLDRADLPAGVEELNQVWGRLVPESPLRSVTFMDARFAQRYRTEERVRTVMNWLTAIALTIACMGLFGLASLAASRRTKEVGIRKALGATAGSVLAMMSREFAWLVLAANVIAWPAAWFTLERWLATYAYRIEVGPALFATAGVGVLLVALATVSGQSWRTARTHPARALRYE